jgi:hypothetical protein
MIIQSFDIFRFLLQALVLAFGMDSSSRNRERSIVIGGHVEVSRILHFAWLGSVPHHQPEHTGSVHPENLRQKVKKCCFFMLES